MDTEWDHLGGIVGQGADDGGPEAPGVSSTDSGGGMTGKGLKRWRLRKGLTQQEVAERLGVNRMTVSRYERGKIQLTGLRKAQVIILTRE